MFIICTWKQRSGFPTPSLFRLLINRSPFPNHWVLHTRTKEINAYWSIFRRGKEGKSSLKIFLVFSLSSFFLTSASIWRISFDWWICLMRGSKRCILYALIYFIFLKMIPLILLLLILKYLFHCLCLSRFLWRAYACMLC